MSTLARACAEVEDRAGEARAERPHAVRRVESSAGERGAREAAAAAQRRARGSTRPARRRCARWPRPCAARRRRRRGGARAASRAAPAGPAACVAAQLRRLEGEARPAACRPAPRWRARAWRACTRRSIACAWTLFSCDLGLHHVDLRRDARLVAVARDVAATCSKAFTRVVEQLALRVGHAQLEVVGGELGLQRQARALDVGGARLLARAARLHRAAHAAPQVDLPARVERDAVAVARCAASPRPAARGAGARAERREELPSAPRATAARACA